VVIDPKSGSPFTSFTTSGPFLYFPQKRLDALMSNTIGYGIVDMRMIM